MTGGLLAVAGAVVLHGVFNVIASIGERKLLRRIHEDRQKGKASDGRPAD